MPNWCEVAYRIEGDKQTLKKIMKAAKNHKVRENSSEDWLGNVLDALKIDFSKYSYMRGFLLEPPLWDEDTLIINTDEAWSRTDFAEALEDNLPVTVYWIAEEPGCEIYETNDSDGKYFTEKYLVEYCLDGNIESEYFDDEASAYKFIESFGCKTTEDIDKYNEENYDKGNYISFHEFQVV